MDTASWISITGLSLDAFSKDEGSTRLFAASIQMPAYIAQQRHDGASSVLRRISILIRTMLQLNLL
jgi:hypothetical protein